jgi:ankyrin repeat protein
MVKLLVENKADINVKTDNGLTAVDWASDHGHYDVKLYLIEQGAK